MKKLGLAMLLMVGPITAGLAQSVVINKIYNATSVFEGESDAVELLVIQDHLDMRGLILKDLSLPDANKDAGGKYKFNNIDLWKDLRRGTTIVLRRLKSQDAGYTEDIDPSDYKLDVLLVSSTTGSPYLTPIQASVTGQHLNITNNDIVMIKADDGSANGTGVGGTIHAFATGNSNTSTYFTELQTAGVPILYSSATTGTSAFQYPTNPAKALSDYNGAKAAVSTETDRGWGVGFGENNIAYIASLRPSFLISAPTSLSGVFEGGNSLKLSWNDNSDNETGFEVEKSTDGTTFTTLTSVAPNVNSYTENNVSPTQFASYRVRAINPSGNSSYSNVFNSASLATAPIVVNKIYNATSGGEGLSDAVELLVIRDNYDLRNLIVKDAETDLTRDAGGKYKFNDIPFWSNVRSGTTIVLRRTASADPNYVEDLDASDSRLDLILENTAYLTAVHLNGHRFNITNTDMVVIKSGSQNGFDDVIHGFASNAGGAATSLFHSVKGPMLVSPAATGTGFFQYPLNPQRTAQDYNGTGAAASSSTNPGWGTGFGQNNIDYILSLRFRAPSALSATVLSANEVELNWQDNSANEEGFQIERSTDGTNFSLLATTLQDIETYTDNSAVASTVYYYRVRGVENATHSSYSNTATVIAGAGIITALNFTPEVLYENQPVNTVAGTFSVDSPDPSALLTYTFAEGAGAEDNASFTISGNQLKAKAGFDYEKKHSYNIRVKATTQTNSSLENSFVVSVRDVNEKPVITAVGPQNTCVGTEDKIILLSGISPGPETSQSLTANISSDKPWFDAIGINLLSDGKAEIKYRLKAGMKGETSISLVLQDNGGTANGGTDTHTETFKLSIHEFPVASVTSDRGESIGRGITARLSASGGENYQWETAAGIIGNTNTADLLVRPSETTTYKVTVTNSGGCSTTQQFTLTVNTNYDLIVASNLLSPNGDGLNDYWKVQNLDLYPDNEVKVFDKTGRMIFYKKSYNSDWDGRVAGSSLNENTYYYIIDFGPGLPKKKGVITMLNN